MTTSIQPPRIEKIDARIATLERRQEHLQRRLDAGEFSSTASADFDRAEVVALESGIKALRFVKAMIP